MPVYPKEWAPWPPEAKFMLHDLVIGNNLAFPRLILGRILNAEEDPEHKIDLLYLVDVYRESGRSKMQLWYPEHHLVRSPYS